MLLSSETLKTEESIHEVSYRVTLYNLNYNVPAEKVAIGKENIAITPDYIAIEVAIEGMNASRETIEKAKAIFSRWV